MGGEVRVPTVLDLRIDTSAIQQVQQRLQSAVQSAQQLVGTLGQIGGGTGGGGGGGGGGGSGGGGGQGGGSGGGGGPGGGGGGGIIPGGGGRAPGGGAPGFPAPPPRELPGKGFGGRRQIPYPDQGGIIRAAHALPFVGAIAAGAIYSAFSNYRHFETFQDAQADAAPFASPYGNTLPGAGYSVVEGLRAQRELAQSSGFGWGPGSTSGALQWMRHRGLSAGDIGGFYRPFAPGAGLGGIADTQGNALGRALGTAVEMGFKTARFPEFMERIAQTVSSAGERGQRTSLEGLLRLQSRFYNTDRDVFGGSAGVRAAGAFSGLAGQVIAPGADPFVQGMLMRQVGGLGKPGVTAWDALLKVQEVSQDPGALATAMMQATSGMGHDMQRFYLHQVLGGQMSPIEIDRMLGGGGAGILGQEGTSPEIGPGRAAAPYLGSAAHRAAMEQGRIGIGQTTAPFVRAAETTLLTIERTLISGLAAFLTAIQVLISSRKGPDLSDLGVTVTDPEYVKKVAEALAAGEVPPPPPQANGEWLGFEGEPIERSPEEVIDLSRRTGIGIINAERRSRRRRELKRSPSLIENIGNSVWKAFQGDAGAAGPHSSLDIRIVDERRGMQTAWVDDSGAVNIAAGRLS